jgi:flavodoxin
MNYVIIYWSRYGNGKKIINYLSDKLKEKKIETKILKTDEADASKLPDADLYIFSAPAEAFNIQKNMRKFMENLQGMEEKKYGIINTHAMKKNRLYKMEKLLSKKNMTMVAGLDFRIGGGSQTGDGLMEGWESKVDDFIDKIK